MHRRSDKDYGTRATSGFALNNYCTFRRNKSSPTNKILAYDNYDKRESCQMYVYVFVTCSLS